MAIVVHELTAAEAAARAVELAEVLLDAVASGASVSFMADLTPEAATEFFTHVARDVAEGRRAVLVALLDGALVGTVQLVLDTPPNQPHRAEIAKLLVHRRARRMGIARALMGRAEEAARRRGRTLLTLDTIAGGDAEQLYEALGYTRVGVIPGYARLPHGPLAATAIFYKAL